VGEGRRHAIFEAPFGDGSLKLLSDLKYSGTALDRSTTIGRWSDTPSR
jgi:hypothetical protein